MIELPRTVENKARLAQADDWITGLGSLIAELEARWSITVGRGFPDATAAFVAEAQAADGTPVGIKLLIPRANGAGAREITALRIAAGYGCATLIRCDERCGALLLERLGPSLSELGLSLAMRHKTMIATAAKMWRPAPDCGLLTGAQKAVELSEYITPAWETVGRPCSERTIDHALRCAQQRYAAHDDERAVLVHGDLHQWNTLKAGDGFKLVDPDGLLAEAEYDLGILMREDPGELLRDGPRERAHWLAAESGLDATAIWEWGVVERVSTGLFLIQVDVQARGREMLMGANRIAEAFQ